MAEREEPISALVVLPTRSGRAIDGTSVITAENLRDYEFDPENAAAVAAAFEEAGFSVGPAVGISLSISGTPSQFTEFFGTEVAPGGGGGWQAQNAEGEFTTELPTAGLPASLAERITAVAFEPPVELLDDGA